MSVAWSVWILGLLLGMRHALDPDHLVAVSTLVAEQRKASWGARLGLFWGLGHAVALLGMGLTLSLLHRTLPPRTSAVFECLVGAVMMVFGVRALLLARKLGGQGPLTRHQHGATWHMHHGPEAHLHLRRSTFALRPLCIGLVHGFAGSGTLAALAMARLPTFFSQGIYIVIFSIGSMLSMAIMSGAAGWGLGKTARSGRLELWILRIAGACAAVVGAGWGYSALRGLLTA